MPFTGLLFLLYLLFSSLARYGLEFLLGEVTYLGPFSYTQVLSLLAVALGVVLGYLLWARQREWGEEEEGEEPEDVEEAEPASESQEEV